MTSINFDEIKELGSVGLDFDTAAALIDNMPIKIQKMIWKAAFYHLYLDEQGDPEMEHVETMIPVLDKKSTIAAKLWEILKEAVDTSRQGMSIVEKSENMIYRSKLLNRRLEELEEDVEEGGEPSVGEVMCEVIENITSENVRLLLFEAGFRYVFCNGDDDAVEECEELICKNSLASRVWDLFKGAIAREML